MARRTRATRTGFTLVECLVASVYLSIAVAGIAGALTFAMEQDVQLDTDSAALSLGRQLMEEIAARPFEAPVTGDHAGWNAGNADKSTYDNVADYDGYTDSTTAGAVNGQGTSAVRHLTFTRTVAFEYRSGPGSAASVSGDFGMVTVTVATNAEGAMPVVLHRLVTKYPVVRQ